MTAGAVVKWKLHEDSESVHHLFVKEHVVPIGETTKEKPPGKTLLCHNVPPYFSYVQLKQIFRAFGDVSKIFLHQKPTAGVPEKPDFVFQTEKDITRGFKVAYIVFTDPKVVSKIIRLSPANVQPIVLSSRPLAGIQKWASDYNHTIVSESELEASVRNFMENFDKNELRRKEMEKQGEEPDDDGWITVTRSGKRASGGLVRSETMEERLREKKRRQDKQLVNFTPAQMKETKMKQLLELKKKFEEDKQRVALLKQQRKFKPF